MSQNPALQIGSNPGFSNLWLEAVKNYEKHTGKSLQEDSTMKRFSDASSATELQALLDEIMDKFMTERERHRALKDKLVPVAEFTLLFSGVIGEASGAVGECAGLVSELTCLDSAFVLMRFHRHISQQGRLPLPARPYLALLLSC